MATIHYDADASSTIIASKKVAIVGYGSQGHAHALNLRDSGVEVRVGLADSSKSRAKAEAAGLATGSVSEVAAWCDVLMMLAPDTAQAAIWSERIAPHFDARKTLMFAHGFNVRYETIKPPPGVDVSMVAPQGPGHRVRETFQAGQGRARARGGTPGRERRRVGSRRCRTRRGSGRRAPACSETTFAEETETDLFGEQAVLCGGVSALVKAGFETLVRGGLPAGGGVLRVHARAEAHRRSDVPRWPQLHALLDQRHRRVRRLRVGAARRRRRGQEGHAGDPRGGAERTASPGSGSRRTPRGDQASTGPGTRSASSRSSRSARRCAR